jgi:hypothetical protein
VSPWTEDPSSSSPAKHKSEDAPSDTAIGDVTPNKKKWSSLRDNVPPPDQSPMHAATNNTANAPVVPPAARSPSKNSQSLTAYLMKHLAFRDQEVNSFQTERAGLQEKMDYFNHTKVELQGLVVEWKCQLCESQKQVLHLRHRLARKVELLQLEVEIRKAMEAKVVMLKGKNAVIHVNHHRLTEDSWKQFEDLYLKRSLVRSHKLELKTASNSANAALFPSLRL